MNKKTSWGPFWVFRKVRTLGIVVHIPTVSYLDEELKMDFLMSLTIEALLPLNCKKYWWCSQIENTTNIP